MPDTTIPAPKAMRFYHPGTIAPGTACIQCNRPNAAQPGTIHNGWCHHCVNNRMTGRTYDSTGQPWTIPQ
jgi:hypothetical protein